VNGLVESEECTAERVIYEGNMIPCIAHMTPEGREHVCDA